MEQADHVGVPDGNAVALVQMHMKKIIFLSILVITGILFGGQIKRAFLSLLILTDSVRPPQKAIMGKIIPGPAVKAMAIPVNGKTLKADLYAPKSGGRHFPLLLVHGINPTGKDDDQLVLLAKNLARAGFLVLVPDFEGMKRLRMRPSDVEDIVGSFLSLAKLKNAKPGGGMMGISYGVGPMLLAAADARVRDRVNVIVSFGGYGDLRAVLLFLLTGYYDYGAEEGYLRPDESFRWVFLYKNLDLVPSQTDRDMLKAIIEKRNRYEIAEADGLVKKLGTEGKAVYDFLANKDPKRFVMLYENLPLSMREYMVRLSPVRILKQSKAYFIIAHGTGDYSIPYTESLRIADAVGDQSRVHVALLPQFMHIEPVAPAAGNSYTRSAVGGWRLFGLIYDLLGRQ